MSELCHFVCTDDLTIVAVTIVLNSFIILCVYDVCGGGHMHVLIYMWRSRAALLSQFFPSTFTGGSGIKLSSSGLCAKCLYTMPWFLRL